LFTKIFYLLEQSSATRFFIFFDGGSRENGFKHIVDDFLFFHSNGFAEEKNRLSFLSHKNFDLRTLI